ncbi:MAG: MerC domain-containing protein [Candidatus Caenarcaniphilales bacterium]|jgi:hypothetical protein|nr:MerC domain-containing protein [Candidatus Caenarcaniphilales bacterium]
MASAQKILDRIGMAASSICAVHCALAPLLITLAPLVGLGFVFEERFETIIIMVTLGLAFLNISWSFYKQHRNFAPFYGLLLGSAVISIAQMGHWEEFFPEPIMMAFGGLSIAISHYINIKLCNHCDTCEKH